jgi:hypothetical protein
VPLELAENVIDEFIEGMEQEETIEEGRAALIAFKGTLWRSRDVQAGDRGDRAGARMSAERFP